MKGYAVQFGDQQWQLHPDRALIWPARKTLIVADVHLGKASVFRAHGVPVPAGTTAGTLARLGRLIDTLRPERLLVLGDLFHARLDPVDTMYQQAAAWRRRHHSLAITLVRGNHDRRAGDPPPEWGVEVVAPHLEESGVCFIHDAPETCSIPTIAGHLHPAARLTDFDGSSVRVPCFVVERSRMLLPAFGEFTGMAVVDAAPGRRLLAAGHGRVVELRNGGR